MVEKLCSETAKRTLKNMQVFIGPRPGKKSIDQLAAMNLTHCCTLLSEREDVQPIKKFCQKLDCEWIWLPIEGGRIDVLREVDLMGYVNTVVKNICDTNGPRIYFHCSAGIHRTGFFVYSLLRLSGLERETARVELAKIRMVTAEQVGEERLDLAEEMIARARSS